MLVSFKNHIIIVSCSLILCGCNFSLVKTEPTAPPAEDRTHYIDHKQADFKPSQSVETTEPVAETPEVPENLWIAISQQINFDTHIEQQRVKSKLNWYQNNQDHLDRIVDRATPYLYFIIEEITQRDLPVELALVPIIESAYQANAVSPMKASGIWQFMPATGKQYGLKRNSWYDGRRDIVASTRAALEYLSRLNAEFDGDWLLALAAYNAGPATIERARKKNQKKGKATDFWSLELHRETRHYVPNLLAIAEIVKQPEQYHLSLTAIPNQPFFSMVDTQGQIDLMKVAEISHTELDVIRLLNPGFRGLITDPDGPHVVLLPINAAQDFSTKLATIPADQRVTLRKHTIRNGETLSHIAERYHTSVYALKQTNRLASHRIRAGKTLLIPVSPDQTFATAEQNIYGEQLVHRVRQGDTLWDLSRAYDVTVTELCEWNGIHRKSTLNLGQSLLVKKPEQQSSAALIKTKADNTPAKPMQYQIQSGDSLWLIARRFGVSVKQLQEWNNIKNKRLVKPGQNILVYVRKKPTGV